MSSLCPRQRSPHGRARTRPSLTLWWRLPDPVAPHFSVTPTPHRSTSLGRHLRSKAVLRLSSSSICGKHVPAQNDCHFWLFHPSVWLGSAVQKTARQLSVLKSRFAPMLATHVCSASWAVQQPQ